MIQTQTYIEVSVHSFYKVINTEIQFSLGGQGQVLVVQNKQRQRYIAKIFSPEQPYKGYFRKQVEILQQLRGIQYVAQIIESNENATKHFDDQKYQTYPVIILQLCQKGDLNKFFLENCKKHKIQLLGEHVAAALFRQILCGLKQIHTRQFLHRDIKPHNLVFDSNFGIKFIDFGYSCKINDDQDSRQIGQVGYHPKQAFQNKYNQKSDIFSCGVILHDLLFFDLVTLFGKNNKQDKNGCIINKSNSEYKLFRQKGDKNGFNNEKIKNRHKKIRQLSKDVIDLFHDIFLHEISERKSIDDILDLDLIQKCASKDQVLDALRDIEKKIYQKNQIKVKEIQRESQFCQETTENDKMQTQTQIVNRHNNNNNFGRAMMRNAFFDVSKGIMNPQSPQKKINLFESLNQQGLKKIFKQFKKSMKTAIKETIKFLKDIGVVRQHLKQSSMFYSRFLFTSRPEFVIAILTARIQNFKKEKLTELTQKYFQAYQVDQLQQDPLCYYNHNTQSIDFDLSLTKKKSNSQLEMQEEQEQMEEHIKIDISGRVRKRGSKYVTVDWNYGEWEYGNIFKTPIQNIMSGIVQYEISNSKILIALTNGQQKTFQQEYGNGTMIQ